MPRCPFSWGEARADLVVAANDGRTAAHLAAANGREGILRLLQEAPPERETCFFGKQEMGFFKGFWSEKDGPQYLKCTPTISSSDVQDPRLTARGRDAPLNP